MIDNWDGLLWLLLLLGPLLILQRNLHHQIQAVFLLITRRTDIAITLFSLLLFPGVFIHEISHFLVARLLGVDTGRFSLLPRPMLNGKLQLGYVETAKTDIIRDSLIGTAPLIAGGLFVIYAGLNRMSLESLWIAAQNLDLDAVISVLGNIIKIQDFWLWFYLTFTVSSTMLPSASDRRAWPSLAIVLIIILTLALFSGAGPWMVETIAPWFNSALRALNVVFAISLIMHVLLLPPIWSMRRLLEKLLGLTVA